MQASRLRPGLHIWRFCVIPALVTLQVAALIENFARVRTLGFVLFAEMSDLFDFNDALPPIFTGLTRDCGNQQLYNRHARNQRVVGGGGIQITGDNMVGDPRYGGK